MAAPTCKELIIDAYQISGVRAANENPSADDMAMGLRLINNDVIDQLRLDEMWPSYVKTYEFMTDSSKIEYTIGVIDPLIAIPPDVPVIQELIRIENAQVRVGNVWTPMRQISNSDYYRMTQAAVSVVPQQFSFNRTRDPYDRFMLSVGTPSGYPIRISCGGVVKNYALDDKVDLPSGYYSTLKFALAELLCIVNALPETQVFMNKKYSECLRRIKEVNAAPPPKLKYNTAGGLYSIGSDCILQANGGI
jgi:hypothetical protein